MEKMREIEVECGYYGLFNSFSGWVQKWLGTNDRYKKKNSNLEGREKGFRGARFAGGSTAATAFSDEFTGYRGGSRTHAALRPRVHEWRAHVCRVVISRVQDPVKRQGTRAAAAVRGLLRRARRPSESGSTRSPGVSGVRRRRRRRRQGRTSVPAALVNVYCGGVTNLPWPLCVYYNY